MIVASPQVIDAITRYLTDEEKAEMRAQNARVIANYKKNTGNDWPYAESDAAKIEARLVDFNMLIPMPEEVQGTTVGTNGFSNFDERGWYGWSIANWGTKWNAYDAEWKALEGDRCELRFDTAWSHPEPVIRALSKKFPEEVIEVAFADEDFGGNLGRYKIEDGSVYDLEQPDFYTEPAYEMAAEIKYERPYAELRAEWDQDEIESAQKAKFARQIEQERGLESGKGYQVIRDEALAVPNEILRAISTKEQADAFWEES